MRRNNQVLLIDADDTLWENNRYFEQAIASFISYLDHRVHTTEEVRKHLNRTERANIAEFGYGVKTFRRSLVRCFQELSHEPLTEERRARILSFADSVAEHELELMPGVADTLAEISRRQRLILVTKGDPEEQHAKLQISGLHPYFAHVEVLPEKHEEAYRVLVRDHACEAERTWMIGNSPRSDINPALAAGLNAVFIPHDYTWVLEHEVVAMPPAGREMLELGSFPELLRHF